MSDRFKSEWIGTDFFKPADWKSFVFPLVQQPMQLKATKCISNESVRPGGEEEELKKELSLSMYLKRERFVLVEMGESDPEKFGKEIDIPKEFDGVVLVELPMDKAEPVEDGSSQWMKWHKFRNAVNNNSKFKVCCFFSKKNRKIQFISVSACP